MLAGFSDYKTKQKKDKSFSMKLLSVTSQNRDPVLVPDASLFCDIRNIFLPSLSLFPLFLPFHNDGLYQDLGNYKKRSPKRWFWIF